MSVPPSAFVAIMLWSTLAVSGVLLAHMPPFFLVGVTLLIGGLCGLPWARDWRVPRWTFALGIYGIFGYHLCIFLALRLAPPVEANLLNYLWPLLMVLLSPVLLKGLTLGLRHVLAGLLGFAGAALVITGGRLEFSTEGTWGYLFAGSAAVIWSTYSLLTKRVPPFPTGAIGLFCAVSGVGSLIVHFLSEPSYNPSLGEVGFLFYLGVGPMGAAFYLWDHAMKRGDPRSIGALSYVTPLISTTFLALSGRATLSASALAALVLILAGAVLGSFSRKS